MLSFGCWSLEGFGREGDGLCLQVEGGLEEEKSNGCQ